MRIASAAAAMSALAACQAAPPDPRGVEQGETLLIVSASGRAESRPDEARLQLGVQSIGASAGEASRVNREKMERVTAALRRLGVRANDLQTRNLTLQRIDYGRDRGRFRADNIVEVRLRDMNRVGEAVTAVTEAGANLLSGPDLRIADQEAASRSAYAGAYRAARARADAYAGAAGLKVVRILSIRDDQAGGPVPYYQAEAMAMDAAPPPVEQPQVRPGMNTDEVRVRVDFALAED